MLQKEVSLQKTKTKNKTGSSINYKITLPRDWVESSGLKPNQPVNLTYTGTSIIVDLKTERKTPEIKII
jgi:bifunctional DNA-binding transcriptional regulator/antitoxin component of YhaV-PrlF toxin-antitoxin module